MTDSVAWLSVIGISENGVEGLSAEARRLISGAALVAGGKRHLALVNDLIKGKTLAWPSPPHDAIPELIAIRPQPVCVLATGDPFHYGMGAVLARHIPPQEMCVISAPSAFSLAAAKLGWVLQNTITIGLNGRPIERLIRHVQPGACIIALSADDRTPKAVAALLAQHGFSNSHMTVLEHLGGTRERIRSTQAGSFALDDIAPLNCIAIEIPDDTKAKSIPLVSGLDDAWFENDGQLTKREIRAVTLSSLAPRRGEVLWDIGLGAGSIAIEWMLADPANRAIGIEKNPERVARARRNALALGVPDLVILEGEAPATLEGLDAPDAIFIGGGATQAMIDSMWTLLKPGGRCVINAISLETEALLLAAERQYGGSLIRLSVERAEPLGTMTGWKPAMTVTQWSVTK